MILPISVYGISISAAHTLASLNKSLKPLV